MKLPSKLSITNTKIENGQKSTTQRIKYRCSHRKLTETNEKIKNQQWKVNSNELNKNNDTPFQQYRERENNTKSASIGTNHHS